MNVFKTICRYYLYCGIEKEEYDSVKRDAYISNYHVWKILHFLMAAVFGFLFATSLVNDFLKQNRLFYLLALLYSAGAIIAFFIMKEDSLAAQLMIYLSISLLFLFGGVISQNQPDKNATTFIVMLLITPMFMIDKPFFMTIELCVASSVFLFWMYNYKTYEIWRYDLVNVITYTIVGCFLNVIANSIRIREFVLTRKINIQKDTDELTGLKNKAALTREINEYLADDSTDKGILVMMDIDHFKTINDTYGHDIGDSVIRQMGVFLGSRFSDGEIAGRFGGDEFIVFVKNNDDQDTARSIAEDLITGVPKEVLIPDEDSKVYVSVGICICSGREKNYSVIFKKADLALYKAKADSENRYFIST